MRYRSLVLTMVALGALSMPVTARRPPADERPGLTAEVAYLPTSQKVMLELNDVLAVTPEGEPGLRGAYFSNPGFEGRPAFVRRDERVAPSHHPRREDPGLTESQQSHVERTQLAGFYAHEIVDFLREH
jgi:hypothetical protein